jgi:hypothetical protein
MALRRILADLIGEDGHGVARPNVLPGNAEPPAADEGDRPAVGARPALEGVDHATVGYHQDLLAGKGLAEPADGAADPGYEALTSFSSWSGLKLVISPRFEGTRPGGLDLGVGEPTPLTDVVFPQVGLDMEVSGEPESVRHSTGRFLGAQKIRGRH